MSGGQTPPVGLEFNWTWFSEAFATEIAIFFTAVTVAETLSYTWKFLKPRVEGKWVGWNIWKSDAVRLSRTQTGYIGAFLAKRTIFVTIITLGISIALYILNVIRSSKLPDPIFGYLQYGLIAFSVLNLIVVSITALFAISVCSEILRQIEQEDKRK